MKPNTAYVLPAILLIALIACSNTDDPVIDEDLLDVLWKVDTLITPEEEIVPGDDTGITVKFTSDFEVRASHCNHYEGTYRIEAVGSITIQFYAHTEMACPSEYAHRLQVLGNALENTTAYSREADLLRLSIGDRKYLVILSTL